MSAVVVRAQAQHAQDAQDANAPPTAEAVTSGNAPDASEQALPKLTLQAALSEAMTRELKVRVAKAEVGRALGLVDSARAGFLPALLGHANYVRWDKERQSNGIAVIPRDQVVVDATLAVPIFAPRAWNETGFASDNVRVAKFSELDIRRTVALTTAQAYLTVIAQHRSIEVTQRALDNANAHYQYAHQRLTGGIGNQVDDVRAAQETATNVAQLERTKASLYQAQEALGFTLGRKTPVDVSDQFDLPAAPNVPDGLRGAQTLRGDVNADRMSLEAQQNLVDDNWAEFAPQLVAQGQLFARDPSTLAAPPQGWQIQVLLTVPFYDGGARYGTIEQRAAVLEQRHAQVEATMRKANSEVRVAFNQARHADASLLAAKQAASFAADALRFASLAYEAGASTNIEVVDAERRARDADTSVVVAEDSARQARVSLLAATGHFP